MPKTSLQLWREFQAEKRQKDAEEKKKRSAKLESPAGLVMANEETKKPDDSKP